MTRFVQAILAADIPVIAEIKPRTGDGDDLLAGRAPAELAAMYAEAGAACLSVVTGPWFGGRLDMLRAVTFHTDLPVLQKDFITRESQLVTAAELGVAAVLMTARLLTTGSLRRLAERALSVGITPFVEVATEAEIAAVPHPQHCVIAVNNKDIQQRERNSGDLDRSTRLLPAVLATETACPVSASGIDTPAQAAHLLATGYAGLLVGTALLRAPSPRDWFDSLAQLLAPTPTNGMGR
ncbi:indole-3-glycerol-phosphate synthase [Actinocrispum wychmicini]|uniref:indole-3-glycerol-phosphate synthase n=1 Tax=Actinocrispum wychmicini TaxID=1213861 RepID=A0A4R2JTI6_9PSEU|nr:indole-3-glycerol-phosphate synthase [Actinocrispum wychmicini]TCO60576.1 indole-3-glycerol phosphate synthase [Actinocrispum wychmicini]